MKNWFGFGLGLFGSAFVLLLLLAQVREQPSMAAEPPTLARNVPTSASLQQATFAGGCFWCMEPPFEKLTGVASVISGYAGGKEKNPTYKGVSSGRTGHTEVVQVNYDPQKISYEKLLDVFWRNIDPTDSGGQFVDRGSQYRPEIFFHGPSQEQAAKRSKQALENSGRFKKPVSTAITRFSGFYAAETYHQDFYLKDPGHYKRYRRGSGRDAFIRRHWGKTKSKTSRYTKPSKQAIRSRLSAIAYRVTQEDGTEPPFKNEFWDNKKAGIYVDVVSGEPLFSSAHKFKSGTGWPSFTKPLVSDHVKEHKDVTFGMTRTEVRSTHGNSHLGHIFPDGPAPTGLRYCINSASLRFVPAHQLKAEGYGEFASSFQ